jgi:hypothetical protein
MSVVTPERRHNCANRNPVSMEVSRNAHHSQLPAMPCVRVRPVTRLGVSVENVVATIETPSSQPGIERPERKYSSLLRPELRPL